jgi:hypothetical protein
VANEQFSFGNIPLMGAGYGIRTQFGIMLPPGGKVAAYVRSTGLQDGDDAAIVDKLVLTLAAGLARCRSGLGDTVVVLPGHSESVTDATMLNSMVAGTRVIGVGNGSAKPTFRWTATASQWAIAVADVLFCGLKLRLEGANGVVKAIVTTAANTTFFDNEIQVASGAALKATIALELGTGADGAFIASNWIYGTATHNVTDGIKVVGTAIDRVRIVGNIMDFSATAGNGNVHVTAAATKLVIGANVMQNDHTASTACVAVDNVAATGMIYDNYFSTVNDGVAAAQGVVFAGTATIRTFQNFSSDEPRKSGTLAPTAVAT